MNASKLKRETTRLWMHITRALPAIFPTSVRGDAKRRWNQLQFDEGASVAVPAPAKFCREGAALVDLSMTSGFGEAVHPAVIHVPEGFGAGNWNYLMSVTPFPNSIVVFENPEFLVSRDGLAWGLPPGGASPVVPAPSDWTGYNSDPALFFDDGQIFMYYREVREGINSLTVSLFVISTRDGVNWSDPTALRVEKTPTNRAGLLMSPSVLKVGGKYFMWYVDERSGGYKIYRSTLPNPQVFVYGEEAEVAGLPENLSPWHVDVVRDGDRLLMALCATIAPGCRSVLIAESTDGGLKWRVLDGKGAAPEKKWGEASLYKAALVRGDGGWKLYYSYEDTAGHWYTVVEGIEI